MCSLSTYANSCVSRFAAAQCKEYARLEDEYLVARDRMRSLLRLRKLTGVSRAAAADNDEERRLADAMAMAIARLKEHIAAHGCEHSYGRAQT